MLKRRIWKLDLIIFYFVPRSKHTPFRL